MDTILWNMEVWRQSNYSMDVAYQRWNLNETVLSIMLHIQLFMGEGGFDIYAHSAYYFSYLLTLKGVMLN
jgi:hypothetical protein